MPAGTQVAPSCASGDDRRRSNLSPRLCSDELIGVRISSSTGVPATMRRPLDDAKGGGGMVAVGWDASVVGASGSEPAVGLWAFAQTIMTDANSAASTLQNLIVGPVPLARRTLTDLRRL